MELVDTVERSPAGVRDARLLLRGAPVLFTLTMFVGAALLFVVQPMFAKLVLPKLGGSPSVWNTCMVFFQGVLLLGYAYAHWSTRWLGVRRQARWHLIVLLLPLLLLPIALSGAEPSAEHPVGWLLATLALSVGAPFFVVSTTAPLLQRWFATLSVTSSRDPYFLYAASNAGSVVSLLAYPLLLEPLIGVRRQSVLWTAAYLVLVIMSAACIWLVNTCGDEQPADALTDNPAETALTVADRVSWVVLSFLPSSLMLGVTSFITADLASVPLLWVLPLALYLLTFVLAFSRRQLIPEHLLLSVTHVLIVLSLLTIFINSLRWTLVPFHLLTFFASALICHRELARRRPGVSHLTEYYVWLSVGGVLGGAFNSLVAPQVFSTVLEYPLILGVIPLALWTLRRDPARSSRRNAIELSAAAACIACGMLWFVGWPSVAVSTILLAVAIGLLGRVVLAARSLGAPSIAVMLMTLIASGWFTSKGTVLFTGRSFFGVHRVIESEDGTHRLLFHGSTVHGRQELNAGDCPLSSYYFPDGPVGEVMNMTRNRRGAVGLIGLGTGTLACYAEPGEKWTFYEIDPMMDHLARRSGLLTQIQYSRGDVSVEIGDGRLTLQAAERGAYDLIVLDAFSSDAIPIHLLTTEALGLYVSRLKADGVLVANISNRYLNLAPILTRAADQHGLHVRSRYDAHVSDDDAKRGRTASHWMVFAQDPSRLQPLDGLPGWRTPAANAAIRPWTDDYSNLLQALVLR